MKHAERKGAVRACRKSAAYENAGTMNFFWISRALLFYGDEHPDPGRTSGDRNGICVDLIKEQIYIAAGLPLDLTQEEITLRGHALECRINAEDPKKNFMPCPGKLGQIHLPVALA